MVPDLPSDDGSAGCGAYARVVTAALEGIDDEIVVVGHSLGGLTAPLVAAERPVSRLVFLCALIPLPGRSWREQFAADPSMIAPGFGRGLTSDDQGRTFWSDHNAAAEDMYGDCPESEVEFALARLRPQAQVPYTETSPLARWPDVPMTYITASEDRVVSAAWGQRAAVERLSAQVIDLPGSHSPFLSRPEALAAVLDEIAMS